MSRTSQSAQDTKEQAAGFIEQTSEQMKNMAQGAADAMKNAVGMADNSASNTTTTNTTVTKRQWWSVKIQRASHAWSWTGFDLGLEFA